MNIKDIAKEIAKEIIKEEKGSDFAAHQLLFFYLEELKEMCEDLIEFPGKIK